MIILFRIFKIIMNNLKKVEMLRFQTFVEANIMVKYLSELQNKPFWSFLIQDLEIFGFLILNAFQTAASSILPMILEHQKHTNLIC